MLTLIENGEVYAPEPLGRRSILLMLDRIARVGGIDRDRVLGLGVEVETIDATGCVVTPGLIDPHEHLAGGSAEHGFNTQTPEIYASEIVSAGITTVVGVLGSDTTEITPSGLLSRVKALKDVGLNALMWVGGYHVPPATITGSTLDDLLYIEEVIGAGEIAIADHRSLDPDPHELARVIMDVHVASRISGKAGRTYLHIGGGKRRLSNIRAVLDGYPVDPDWLYLTHVQRTEELLDEAIELVRRGVWADLDVTVEDLTRWLPYYLEHGGDATRVTVSSDAYRTSPGNLIGQLRALVTELGWGLERALPFATSNTARALGLEPVTGGIAPGLRADLLVLRGDSLEVVEVIARGKRLLREGRIAFTERFLDESNREIHLVGRRAAKGRS